MDSNSRDNLWNWAFHEDNLFSNRLQIFLTFHGFLIAALSFAFKNKASFTLLFILSILGFIIGILGFFDQLRANSIYSALLKELEKDNLFNDVMNKSKLKIKFKRTDLLIFSYSIIIIFWISLSIISLIKCNAKI